MKISPSPASTVRGIRLATLMLPLMCVTACQGVTKPDVICRIEERVFDSDQEGWHRYMLIEVSGSKLASWKIDPPKTWSSAPISGQFSVSDADMKDLKAVELGPLDKAGDVPTYVIYMDNHRQIVSPPVKALASRVLKIVKASHLGLGGWLELQASPRLGLVWGSGLGLGPPRLSLGWGAFKAHCSSDLLPKTIPGTVQFLGFTSPGGAGAWRHRTLAA